MMFAFVIDVFTSLLVCSYMYLNIYVQAMMNKIEACAVEYLYRSRDSEFAKTLVNSTNGELSSVAHAVVENPLK